MYSISGFCNEIRQFLGAREGLQWKAHSDHRERGLGTESPTANALDKGVLMLRRWRLVARPNSFKNSFL